MVGQGEIIYIDFAPTKGRKQSGECPVVVVSNTKYNLQSGFVLACPITSTTRAMNIRIPLDEHTTAKGDILCEQSRLIDLRERLFRKVETVSAKTLHNVYKVINALIVPMI